LVKVNAYHPHKLAKYYDTSIFKKLNVNVYDLPELAKYFDPFIFKNLGALTFEETRWISLAVAFWDVGGFSLMCNKLVEDNAKITYFLRDYFNTAARIISKHKGILDKYIGDGILAYFGYINARNFPNKSIMAALDLKSSFQKIKEKHESIWLNHNGKKIDVSLRCGIHLGKVIFGILETGSRKQVTVIGSNVNFAGRLSDFAQNDEIIVSEELKNATANNFRFTTIKVAGRLEIKSFSGVTEVFEVTGRAEDSVG
jgi:adenylate cyclase